MQFVIGIDPSLTSTGIIALDETGTLVHRASLSSKPSGPNVVNRLQRYNGLISQVIDVIRKYRPAIACIEGYTLGSNSPGTADRIEFGGLLRWSVVSAGVKLIEVNQSTLKKWATGKGAFPGGGKTPMIVAITQRYGVTLHTDDEIDAYALARVAHQIAGFSQPATEFQRDAINVAVNGKPPKPKKKRSAT